jgi:ligand-binding SRPBCC domain-containing protein
MPANHNVHARSEWLHDFLRDPIVETIAIRAPIERCFALSTRIELVQRTLGMKLIDSGVVGGVTTGHITANSRVVWRGWKFGLLTQHHTLITAFEPPHPGRIGDLAAQFDGQRVAWFEDSQEHGRFGSFRHLHLFRQYRHDVRLEDHIHFALPFGPLGRLAAKFIVAPHISALARQRFAMIKELAEGEGWRAWLENTPA